MTSKFSVVKLFLFVLVLASSSLFLFAVPTMAAGGGPIPPAPQKVWAQAGPGNGEVTLYWDEAPYADRYGVVYGTSSNNYQYGALNIGNEKSRSYTVKGLNGGSIYYFRVVAAHGEASSPFSNEVKATPWGGASAKAYVAAAPKASRVSTAPVTKAKPSATGEVWAKSGPAWDEVTVYWKSMASADNYHIVYGTAPGKYSYGALNVGKTNSFKIGKLAAGTTYYVAVVPVLNNRALYTTAATTVRTWTSSVETVQTTKANLVQPKEPVYTIPPETEGSKTLTPKKDVKGVSDYQEPKGTKATGYQKGIVVPNR
jgi:hypothetical protein